MKYLKSCHVIWLGFMFVALFSSSAVRAETADSLKFEARYKDGLYLKTLNDQYTLDKSSTPAIFLVSRRG